MNVTAKQIAQKFIERAEALELKGKKRDAAALDYFCGAAAALQAADMGVAGHNIGMCAALLVAPRGYKAVCELAAADRTYKAEVAA